MLDEIRLAELTDKKKFVERIGNTIKDFNVCIDKLDYDVFTVNAVLYEYLVVTYKGGAIATTICTGNSLSAIFDEIARLFNGGYYDEVLTYRQLRVKATQVLE